MDCNYFRQNLPYKVEVLNGQLIVSNRDYKEIYKVKIKDEKKVQNLFERIASSRPDCLRPTSCFLYDDATDPVGNKQSFDKDFMADYLKRLNILFIEVF